MLAFNVMIGKVGCAVSDKHSDIIFDYYFRTLICATGSHCLRKTLLWWLGGLVIEGSILGHGTARLYLK